jgi:ParB family chromosome partitioning protein
MSSTPSKGVAALLSQRGDTMKESMGVGAAPPGTLAVPIPATNGQYQGTGRDKDALVVDLDRLAPDPDQPRKTFAQDAIDEMAASMEALGQLQPIRIRWGSEAGVWIIIDGERRFRAAKQLGRKSIQCVEDKKDLTPDQILEAQLAANIVREDVPPVEAAAAVDRLLKLRGWSQRELASYLRVSSTKVQKAAELHAAPEPVKEMVVNKEIVPAVAIEAGRADTDEEKIRIARKARDEKMTKAETAAEVQRSRAKPSGAGAPRARLKTAWTHKAAGCTVAVENPKGLDNAAIANALRSALAKVEAVDTGRTDAA